MNRFAESMILRCRHPMRLLGSVLLVSAASAAEPVMYRGNAAHRANYEAAPIERPPRVKWKTALAGEVFSSPVVADGVAYVGSNHNRFYAIDVETGKIRWAMETLGAVNSSPAVADGVVYFGDFSGRFTALDAKTGTLKWVYRVHGERLFGAYGYSWAKRRKKYYADYCDVFLSSPTIVGDTVYYASGNGAVFALERGTGERKWNFATDDVIHTSPAVADGRLFVGGWDSYFYCLDAATGELLWKRKTGDDPEHHNAVGILSAPVVEGDTVYFGCRDAHLYALDVAKGTVRWKKQHGSSWVIASPVIVGDLICYQTSASLQFLALDKRTGETTYELRNRSWAFSSPVAAEHMVYFGTFAGDLNAFDTRTGKLRWVWQTDAARRNEHGFLDRFGAFDLNATAFAEWDPERMVEHLEKMYSVGGIVGTPLPHEDVILVPTTDGFLYALKAVPSSP